MGGGGGGGGDGRENAGMMQDLELCTIGNLKLRLMVAMHISISTHGFAQTCGITKTITLQMY